MISACMPTKDTAVLKSIKDVEDWDDDASIYNRTQASPQLSRV